MYKQTNKQWQKTVDALKIITEPKYVFLVIVPLILQKGLWKGLWKVQVLVFHIKNRVRVFQSTRKAKDLQPEENQVSNLLKNEWCKRLWNESICQKQENPNGKIEK